jgi:serine/threonine-protein kinase
MSATDSHDGQIQGALEGETLDMGSLPLPREADLFEPGEIIGDSYKVIELLGRGAMGMVYRAEHLSMTSEYAVKVLTTRQLNDLAVMRFQNEAQALAKLNHPNLIAIYNFGLHEGRLPFYVMDLLHGENLLDKVEKFGPMPLNVAIPAFIEICNGLSYAHRKGVLHRDVKPANFVMLDTPDVRGARIKIVDFGLVKFAEELKPDVQKLTAVGDVCGSPSYMSPEQASGQRIDPRADIYSLGCSIFQVVTGKLPFVGRNATETMMMQYEKEAPSLSSKAGTEFPYDFERIVAKMLAKQPMDRYQTMDALAQDLKNVMDGQPLGTPPAPEAPARRSSRSTSKTGAGEFNASATIDPSSSPDGARTDGATSQRFGANQRNNDAAGQAFGAAPNISQRSRLDSGGPALTNKENDQGGSGSEKKILIAAIAAGVVILSAIVGIFAWQALQPVKGLPHVETASSIQSLPGKTDTADSTEPFSKIVTANNKQFVEFKFPTKESSLPIPFSPFGMIASGITDVKQIGGTVRFPKGAPLYMVPGRLCTETPHFFERFRPGEITGIYFPPVDTSDETFIAGLKTPGISQIFCNYCSTLTPSIILPLSSLNLEILFAKGLPVDGHYLARAHFWPNLKVLDLGGCANLTPILKQLVGSKKLEMLGVAGIDLHDSDYQLIADIPGLYCLNVGYDHLTPANFATLSRLPNLHTLNLIRSKISGVDLARELKRFPHLTTVCFATDDLSAADKAALKRACPHLKQREEDPALLQMNNRPRRGPMRGGVGFGSGMDRRDRHPHWGDMDGDRPWGQRDGDERGEHMGGGRPWGRDGDEHGEHMDMDGGGRPHHMPRFKNGEPSGGLRFMFAMLQSEEPGDDQLLGPTVKLLSDRFVGKGVSPFVGMRQMAAPPNGKDDILPENAIEPFMRGDLK